MRDVYNMSAYHPPIAVPSAANVGTYLSNSICSMFSGTAQEIPSHASSPFGPRFEMAGAFPDLVLVTADNARFFVHISVLLQASTNNFANVFNNTGESFHVPETGFVMDIALHVIYGIPYVHRPAPLDVVEAAIATLTKYGITVQAFATPPLPLYGLLLSHAPFRPIETYAIAGHYNMELVAVATSSHLLGYDTSKLSDELVVKMGSVYLRRLCDLHSFRLKTLRDIVLRPPRAHIVNSGGGQESLHSELGQMWAFAAAELVWEALPSKFLGCYLYICAMNQFPRHFDIRSPVRLRENRDINLVSRMSGHITCSHRRGRAGMVCCKGEWLSLGGALASNLLRSSARSSQNITLPHGNTNTSSVL